MPHFVVFSNERLEGVHDFVGRLNGTNNTMDFTQIWDGATRDLGRAAFAHHLVFPEDTLVIVPSILDLFLTVPPLLLLCGCRSRVFRPGPA